MFYNIYDTIKLLIGTDLQMSVDISPEQLAALIEKVERLSEQVNKLSEDVSSSQKTINNLEEVVERLGQTVETLDDSIACTQTVVNKETAKTSRRLRDLDVLTYQLDGEIERWVGARGIIGWIVPHIESFKNILGYVEPAVEENV